MRSILATCYASFLCAALLLLVSTAEAHHSLNAYDSTTVRELTATVTAYEWRNPHVRIHLRAAGTADDQDALIFEGANTAYAVRLGWGANSFRTGDTITAAYNPFLNGRPGGHLIEITTADGEVYSLIRFRARSTRSPAGPSAPE